MRLQDHRSKRGNEETLGPTGQKFTAQNHRSAGPTLIAHLNGHVGCPLRRRIQQNQLGAQVADMGKLGEKAARRNPVLNDRKGGKNTRSGADHGGSNQAIRRHQSGAIEVRGYATDQIGNKTGLVAIGIQFQNGASHQLAVEILKLNKDLYRPIIQIGDGQPRIHGDAATLDLDRSKKRIQRTAGAHPGGSRV